jgi:pimeloyl-ACP methyl ester carboxylesterase
MRILPSLTDAALLLGESAWGAELVRLAWSYPDLARQPHGHGEPVVVLPGFATDDRATWMLRRYLRELDYRVYGWKLGVNHGDVLSLIPSVKELAQRCAIKRGQRVRLVGWSLGGLIAREIARDEPDLVERVITLGSPTCIPRYASARRWFSVFGHDLEQIACAVEKRGSTPIRVPVTAIHAIFDGIVGAADCADSDEAVEHIDVDTNHLGLGLNPDVYRIVAQRLATLAPRFDAVRGTGQKPTRNRAGSGAGSAEAALRSAVA